MAGAKYRAQIKSLPYNLDRKYLIDLWESQDGCCAISGLPFNLTSTSIKGQPRYDAPSIDRIEPSQGYIKGNIRLVCYQVNIGIHEYGLECFLNLCKTVIKYQNTGII